ncbi:MAG: PepSY domain-containing protein [Hyphomicrobiales bacterium]|nr:PepSY domain-containing protein [Hyphomicrobiales bacterium]
MKRSITHTLAIGAIAGSAMLLPLAAHAQFATGDFIGKTESEISDALRKKGYEVTEVEMEHGKIQAEVKQNDAELEIHIDPATGKIVKVEKDD